MSASFNINDAGDRLDISIQGSVVASFSLYGSSFQGEVLNRTTSSPDLLLSNLNQVHKYTGTGNLIHIPTLILEDAVYEMHVNFDSDTLDNFNVDPYLLPNSYAEAAAYAGEFQYNMISKASNTNVTSLPTSNVTVVATGSTASNDTTTPDLCGFWFDQYSGILGVAGTVVMRLDNRRRNKTILFNGGDSNGIATGHSAWINTTRTWYRIGMLRLYAGGAGSSNWYSNIDGAAAPSEVSWTISIRRIY